MPSKEQKRKTKEQFEILSNPDNIVKKGREVQSMDLLKSNMITSKRKSQLETHGRKNICLLRTDGTETI